MWQFKRKNLRNHKDINIKYHLMRYYDSSKNTIRINLGKVHSRSKAYKWKMLRIVRLQIGVNCFNPICIYRLNDQKP